MAKYHYRVSGETSWQGLSGTAILAIQNKANSGKKININSVQISPQTSLGASVTPGTYPSTSPTSFKIIPVSSISGGETWTPAKMDTNANDFPVSTIQVKTRSSYVPFYRDIWEPVTDSVIAVGDVVFTPEISPSWGVNQFRYNGSFLNIASGENAGRYRITSNTATSLTIEAPGFQSTAPATGTIQTIDQFCSVGIMKNFSPSAVPFGQNLGYGTMNYRTGNSGLIWLGTNNPSLEKIKIKQGEKIALVAFPL